MPSVSIIIVNFNAGDMLPACVASIVDVARSAEIIVVDNDSQDGSIEKLVARFGSLKNLMVVRNNSNMGFAGACNTGTRRASGEYLFYLNPDCLINDRTIPALVAALERGAGKVGMAGGRLMNPDETEQAGGRRDIPTPWRAFARLSGLYRLSGRLSVIPSDYMRHREPVPDNTMEVEAVSGACMMVPRKIIDEVGCFDEGYFLHVEDLDWCMRIRAGGWKVVFVPEAEVLHFKGVCSTSRPFFVEWHKHLGLMRFYRKFYGRKYSGLLMTVVAAGVWGHFLWVIACRIITGGTRRD